MSAFPTFSRGLTAPILTPFEDDGSVSHGRYLEHALRLLEEGCVALVPFGTTGEALSVGIDERMAALDVLVNGGIDPVLLLPGTGLSNVPDTVRLTRHAVGAGCAAVLVLPPFYIKDPSDQGLVDHLESVIEGVADDRLRIVLYHIPQVAGVGWPVDVVRRLQIAHPDTVVGIKDSSGDWSNTSALFGIDGLVVWPGSEGWLLDGLRSGGPGCISATANVNAPAISEVVALHLAGRDDEAVDALGVARQWRSGLGEPLVPAMKRLLAQRLDDPTWANVRPPFEVAPA
ncbi:MAG: dihydrodipicolinate synthase family protein [Actinobacteria bacterium]|nr:dihydrodipicolinate synthase family protein [Actinomycetota bacterium]